MDGNQPKRKAGRPKGSLGAVLADLNDQVTLEDFGFIRALVNGIEPDKAFLQYYGYRHFDASGSPTVPHGLSIAAHAKRLTDLIMRSALLSGDDLVKLMAKRIAEINFERAKASHSGTPRLTTDKTPLPSLDDWMQSEDIDPDFYTETDLLDLYKDYLRAFKQEHGITSNDSGSDATQERALLEAQIQAINLLQNRLASLPMPQQPVSTWIARTIAEKLVDLGVRTMGDLVQFISNQGRRWPRKIKGMGPVRAGRLLGWLDENQATLGSVITDGPQWLASAPLQRKIEPLMVAGRMYNGITALVPDADGAYVAPMIPGVPVARQGIAPLELMQVPPHMDGSFGLFRSSTPNHYGAKNDFEAIRIWLKTFLDADKLATFDAYRREIERFYLWCILEAQVPLSSVSLGHALGYQQFLKAIPPKYITTERVARHDLRWKPFRGQLDPKSQAYAIGVVGQFFRAAHVNGYLTGNPFDSVKSASAMNRDLDTSRSLSKADLVWLKQALADHLRETPDGVTTGVDDLSAALRRRVNLIFHIGLSTGLRLSEISGTTIANIQPAMVNGDEDERFWMLEVLGKGKKIRTVPISEELRQMILAHHADVRKMLMEVGQEAHERLAQFEKRPPLICALRSPPGHDNIQIDNHAPMANDNLALGKVGLYRVVKAFFTGAAKPQIREIDRKLQELLNRQKVATAKDDHEAGGQLQEQYQKLRRELAIWSRRSAMSTHWMRHTFAIGVLRDNPNDAGLKLAQQLLGHTSIATTQIYLKVDDTDKTRAVFNLKPFG